MGDVLRIRFPSQHPSGHEQTGTRPAVVVGIPELLGSPRFPALIVVPFTTRDAADTGYVAASPALYPAIRAGAGGLTADSVALVDNIRAVDITRILDRLGHLNPDQYAPIRSALRGMCDL